MCFIITCCIFNSPLPFYPHTPVTLTVKEAFSTPVQYKLNYMNTSNEMKCALFKTYSDMIPSFPQSGITKQSESGIVTVDNCAKSCYENRNCKAFAVNTAGCDMYVQNGGSGTDLYIPPFKLNININPSVMPNTYTKEDSVVAPSSSELLYISNPILANKDYTIMAYSYHKQNTDARVEEFNGLDVLNGTSMVRIDNSDHKTNSLLYGITNTCSLSHNLSTQWKDASFTVFTFTEYDGRYIISYKDKASPPKTYFLKYFSDGEIVWANNPMETILIEYHWYLFADNTIRSAKNLDQYIFIFDTVTLRMSSISTYFNNQRKLYIYETHIHNDITYPYRRVDACGCDFQQVNGTGTDSAKKYFYSLSIVKTPTNIHATTMPTGTSSDCTMEYKIELLSNVNLLDDNIANPFFHTAGKVAFVTGFDETIPINTNSFVCLLRLYDTRGYVLKIKDKDSSVSGPYPLRLYTSQQLQSSSPYVLTQLAVTKEPRLDQFRSAVSLQFSFCGCVEYSGSTQVLTNQRNDSSQTNFIGCATNLSSYMELEGYDSTASVTNANCIIRDGISTTASFRYVYSSNETPNLPSSSDPRYEMCSRDLRGMFYGASNVMAVYGTSNCQTTLNTFFGQIARSVPSYMRPSYVVTILDESNRSLCIDASDSTSIEHFIIHPITSPDKKLTNLHYNIQYIRPSYPVGTKFTPNDQLVIGPPTQKVVSNTVNNTGDLITIKKMANNTYIIYKQHDHNTVSYVTNEQSATTATPSAPSAFKSMISTSFQQTKCLWKIRNATLPLDRVNKFLQLRVDGQTTKLSQYIVRFVRPSITVPLPSIGEEATGHPYEPFFYMYITHGSTEQCVYRDAASSNPTKVKFTPRLPDMVDVLESYIWMVIKLNSMNINGPIYHIRSVDNDLYIDYTSFAPYPTGLSFPIEMQKNVYPTDWNLLVDFQYEFCGCYEFPASVNVFSNKSTASFEACRSQGSNLIAMGGGKCMYDADDSIGASDVATYAALPSYHNMLTANVPISDICGSYFCKAEKGHWEGENSNIKAVYALKLSDCSLIQTGPQIPWFLCYPYSVFIFTKNEFNNEHRLNMGTNGHEGNNVQALSEKLLEPVPNTISTYKIKECHSSEYVKVSNTASSGISMWTRPQPQTVGMLQNFEFKKISSTESKYVISLIFTPVVQATESIQPEKINYLRNRNSNINNRDYTTDFSDQYREHTSFHWYIYNLNYITTNYPMNLHYGSTIYPIEIVPLSQVNKAQGVVFMNDDIIPRNSFAPCFFIRDYSTPGSTPGYRPYFFVEKYTNGTLFRGATIHIDRLNINSDAIWMILEIEKVPFDSRYKEYHIRQRNGLYLQGDLTVTNTPPQHGFRLSG